MLYWSNVSARSRLALSSNSRKYPRGRSVSLLRTMRTSAMAHALAVKSPTTSSASTVAVRCPVEDVVINVQRSARVTRGTSDCEADFGAEKCELAPQRTTSGGSVFMPLMAG